jgi:hypothetical protein
MALEMIYYGADTSHRVSVLVAAGYAVKNCKSPSELTQCLQSGDEILAVLFCDQVGDLPLDVIAAARARCSAPIILFRESAGADDPSAFDFIIPNLTPPGDWLRDIAEQIERHRRPVSQQPPQSVKVLPIDGSANKIRLMERENSTTPDAAFEILGPPPRDPTDGAGPGQDPRSFI